MAHALAAFAALAIIGVILWDAFETIVLPRRVARRVRLTRFVYRYTWLPWRAAAHRFGSGERRETALSFYGPLSLLLLLAVWATALVLGFAGLHWGLRTDMAAPEGSPSFGALVYNSGETFFTLGFGDITPRDAVGRTLAVVEVATGFGFLALVISYLPVLYQAFSRRETSISLLDARAGSPPSAVEFLRRYRRRDDLVSIPGLLRDWERWCAELLESHLSYPLLMYYRSQHEHQSWVAALTMVLDLCALVIVGVDGVPRAQAELTFAMARHAAVDLGQVFRRPSISAPDRLPPTELERLRIGLAAAGIPLRAGPDADAELATLRATYEPYIRWLSEYLLMPIPPWIPADEAADAWQTSAWERAKAPQLP